MSKSSTDALRKLQLLRWMSWLEGGTLLLLLLVAVPLKRLAGILEVVSWMVGGSFKRVATELATQQVSA